MEEFVYVCGLLQSYLTEKRRNNQIWALISMKNYSKITFSHVNLKYQAAESQSSQSRAVFPLYDRPCLYSRSNSQDSVSVVQNIGKEEEGDEFEDLVLRKLEQIQMKMAILKQCKKTRSETPKITEEELSKQQSSEVPFPQIKYIPLGKIMRKNKGIEHFHETVGNYAKSGLDGMQEKKFSRKTSSQMEEGSVIESRKSEDISEGSFSHGLKVRPGIATKLSQMRTKRHSYSNSQICIGEPEYSFDGQPSSSQIFQQKFPLSAHRKLNSHLSSYKKLNRTFFQPNMKKQKHHINISLRQ